MVIIPSIDVRDGRVRGVSTEWGDIEDISTPNRLRLAVERLRSTLASQRVVWISSDPLTALRVDADPRCGITPLAHLGGGY